MESSDRELANYATTMPADIETVAGEVTGREVVTGKEQGEEATTIKAIYKEKILVTNGETGEATTGAVEVSGEEEVDTEEVLAAIVKAPAEETTPTLSEDVDASGDDTNLPPDVETVGYSDAGNEPVFGARETTTEATGATTGDSETPGTDMMDGLDTTEQDVKFNEAPTLAKEENVEAVKATTISQEDPTIQEEGVEATTVSINGLSTTNKKIIEDIKTTTVKIDEFTAEIPENPEILDQATEVNTKEGVTTLSPKEPILDTSNEATTAAGELEETSLAG